MTLLSYVVSLVNKARHQLSGDDPAPWYTRWAWWVVLGVAAALVVLIAMLINNRMTTLKYELQRAAQIEKSERLKTMNAATLEESAKHRQAARDARAAFDTAEEKLRTEESLLKDLRASISKATTLEELDRIAETLK